MLAAGTYDAPDVLEAILEIVLEDLTS